MGDNPSELPHAPIDAATLFREHAAFVARFARRLGVPSAAIDDVVQEVFLIAHRKGGYVPGNAQPRTWLAAIALNGARSERRAAGRRTEPSSPAVELSVSTTPEPQRALETQQSLERVQAALDTLDIEHRATFVLYEIEDASSESIAAAFNIPVGTVYSRLHHARRRFLLAHQALVETDVRSAGGSQ